jgi:hypothetical protein
MLCACIFLVLVFTGVMGDAIGDGLWGGWVALSSAFASREDHRF